MTERSAHDDPVDDTGTAADADTRVDDAPFEYSSADVAPELFPAEPTATGAGTGGTPGRPDSDSITSPWVPRIGPSFPRFRSLGVLRPDEQLVMTNREFQTIYDV